MTEGVLAGCRILVAEDEYFIASETVRLLSDAGATIVGPVGTVEQVQTQVAKDGFDVAILDVRLDQDLIFSAADAIRQAGVPIAFMTGYDETVLPARFAGVPLCQKPCPDETLFDVVRELCAG